MKLLRLIRAVVLHAAAAEHQDVLALGGGQHSQLLPTARIRVHTMEI